VFAATDPSLDGETGLVVDTDCARSDALTAAPTPDLTAAALVLPERVLKATR
jgi:hypothetical protein